MSRFIIRNYGPSRQVAYGGEQICLSNDQSIETDDAEMAAVFGEEESIHVADRGEDAAAFVPPEEFVEKHDHQVTVDDVEAVHDEKFPDEDGQSDTEIDAQAEIDEAIGDSEELTYDDMTIPELKTIAKDREIKGISKMKKGALIEALESYDEAGENSAE